MLTIHQSNRLEVLADAVCELSAAREASPFEPFRLIAPNYGLARWLTLRFADRNGVAANLRFQFPAEFSWEMLRTVIDELPEDSAFSPGVLRWRLFERLNDNGDRFPELSDYLERADQRRVFELAMQLERLFDRYLFYRPELIRDWEQGGEPGDWQAELWRTLSAGGNNRHWVGLRDAFLHLLPEHHRRLPEQAVFFGVTDLSPGYLEMLGELGKWMDIHFFAVNPCREFWSDIVPEKVRLSLPDEVGEYLEIGNPLLASLGRQGRDFFDLLLGLNDEVEEVSRFVEHDEPATLLQRVQNDILDLREPDREAEARIDDSIRILSCHSLMREVEVVHDHILDILQRNPDIQPEDIVILTPDIEQAAPYVEAVFGNAPQQIPFSIADRRYGATAALPELVEALLELPDSRFEVNRVLNILDSPLVREKLGLDSAAVARITDWLEATRVRWGIDAAYRRKLGIADSDEHSWRQGLDRLLLGTMSSDPEFFGETLPYADIEGSAATALGALAQLLGMLSPLADWRSQAWPLPQWLDRLDRLIDGVAAEDAARQGQRQQLRDAFFSLRQQAALAGFEQAIDFHCFRQVVRQQLDSIETPAGFLSGGVTVSRLTPMRSMPFRVVCLLGVNDGQFPRRNPTQSFDRMARRYRRGDRSARAEDRYLFLESLLAARDKLVISYTGQDIQTNEARPASVLVSELLDYLEEGYGIDADALVVKQPLQPFSTRYLGGDERLFTHARYFPDGETHETPFSMRLFEPGFSLDDEPPTLIEISELASFLHSPVRHFLRQRMQIAAADDVADLQEREPFAVEGFDDQRIREMIWEAGEGADRRQLLRRLRAEGLLPHGKPGERAFGREWRTVEAFRQRPDVRALAEQPCEERLIDLHVGEYRLRGRIGDVGERERIVIRMQGKAAWAGQRLPLWLEHLLLAASSEGAFVSRVIAPFSTLTIRPVDDPAPLLETLIAAWREGRRRPIPLFPKAGHEYAVTGNIHKAESRWWGSGPYAGEADQEAHRIAFRGVENPLDEEFVRWSERIFLPLVEHFEETGR